MVKLGVVLEHRMMPQVLPDHVHMLLQLPAKTPVSEAVKYLKGGSSRVIRSEYPELEEFLWGVYFMAGWLFC
ncbi:MAG: hypothetical protein ACD_28C00138G0003 [uncultured bacterium]|nr:MAG: hypothetical protein ACD_28C00138G0003 [uncultured bacterium]